MRIEHWNFHFLPFKNEPALIAEKFKNIFYMVIINIANSENVKNYVYLYVYIYMPKRGFSVLELRQKQKRREKSFFWIILQ